MSRLLHTRISRICGIAAITFAALALFQHVSLAAEANAAQSLASYAQSSQSKDSRVVAVLFSVSQTENARKQFQQIPNIDLLEVNGAPMIMHVYGALLESKRIHKIIVVAAPEVRDALSLDKTPGTSFVPDSGDAAKNIEASLDQVSKDDLIMFIPSDLVLVTAQGLDNLIQRVMQEKHADILFPIVSRQTCESAYPDEKRTYANFKEGQFTGAHIEFLRPDSLLGRVNEIRDGKDELYHLYYMRQNTLGLARFMGLRLTLKYIFGTLSAQEIEQHIFKEYSVAARALRWDDPDLSTDLSEPGDIQMVQRALRERELKNY